MENPILNNYQLLLLRIQQTKEHNELHKAYLSTDSKEKKLILKNHGIDLNNYKFEKPVPKNILEILVSYALYETYGPYNTI